jgi:hypothetical protein
VDNKIEDVVLWDMTVYILVDGYLEDGGSRFLRNLVPVYQRTWCHIPGDFYFDTQQCENVKYYTALRLLAVRESFNNKIFLTDFIASKITVILKVFHIVTLK